MTILPSRQVQTTKPLTLASDPCARRCLANFGRLGPVLKGPSVRINMILMYVDCFFQEDPREFCVIGTETIAQAEILIVAPDGG